MSSRRIWPVTREVASTIPKSAKTSRIWESYLNRVPEKRTALSFLGSRLDSTSRSPPNRIFTTSGNGPYSREDSARILEQIPNDDPNEWDVFDLLNISLAILDYLDYKISVLDIKIDNVLNKSLNTLLEQLNETLKDTNDKDLERKHTRDLINSIAKLVGDQIKPKCCEELTTKIEDLTTKIEDLKKNPNRTQLSKEAIANLLEVSKIQNETQNVEKEQYTEKLNELDMLHKQITTALEEFKKHEANNNIKFGELENELKEGLEEALEKAKIELSATILETTKKFANILTEWTKFQETINSRLTKIESSYKATDDRLKKLEVSYKKLEKNIVEIKRMKTDPKAIQEQIKNIIQNSGHITDANFKFTLTRLDKLEKDFSQLKPNQDNTKLIGELELVIKNLSEQVNDLQATLYENTEKLETNTRKLADQQAELQNHHTELYNLKVRFDHFLERTSNMNRITREVTREEFATELDKFKKLIIEMDSTQSESITKLKEEIKGQIKALDERLSDFDDKITTSAKYLDEKLTNNFDKKLSESLDDKLTKDFGDKLTQDFNDKLTKDLTKATSSLSDQITSQQVVIDQLKEQIKNLSTQLQHTPIKTPEYDNLNKKLDIVQNKYLNIGYDSFNDQLDAVSDLAMFLGYDKVNKKQLIPPFLIN